MSSTKKPRPNHHPLVAALLGFMKDAVGMVCIAAIPVFLLWLAICAFFPSSYYLVKTPLCGESATMELRDYQRSSTVEDEEGRLVTSKSSGTNVFCVYPDGKQEDVSTTGWLFLIAISLLIVTLLAAVNGATTEYAEAKKQSS